MSDRRERTYEQSRPGAWRCPVCGATVPDELVLASLPPKHEHADRSCLSRYVSRRSDDCRDQRDDGPPPSGDRIRKFSSRQPAIQGCERVIMPGAYYPRRQQYRRLLHARGGATAGVVAAVAAAVAWAAGATRLAGVLLLVVVGCS